MTSDSDTSADTDSSIGVVTAVETPRGDTIDAADITADNRRDWCDTLKDRLNAIDGIDGVFIAGLSSRNQSASFEITVETADSSHGVQITRNLRSISQQLRRTLEDTTVISEYQMMESPTRDGGDNHYDTNLYVIDVWFY